MFKDSKSHNIYMQSKGVTNAIKATKSHSKVGTIVIVRSLTVQTISRIIIERGALSSREESLRQIII
jgi:anti-sigma regulatory factor (Ser/Thr protein kinase)